MIARIKYIFLYCVFYMSICIIRHAIEACMCYEIDQIDGVYVGKTFISEDLICSMAELHRNIVWENEAK